MTPVDISLSDPEAPWCEVRLLGRSIRYRRVGSGKPLILATTRSFRDSLWPSVAQFIAERQRIYIPEVPSARTDFNAWLRSFMEGVGAESVSLVGEGEFCLRSLEFALVDSDRLERLVLLPAGVANETGLCASLGYENGGATLPILLLRREHPERAALEIVRQFFDHRRLRTP